MIHIKHKEYNIEIFADETMVVERKNYVKVVDIYDTFHKNDWIIEKLPKEEKPQD